MAQQPYERTVAELMVEAAAELEYPTTRGEVILWFAEHYPKVKASTIRALIVGLTANDRNRHHYTWLERRDPLFTRHPDGSLAAFKPSEAEDLDEAADLDAPVGAAVGVRARGVLGAVFVDELGRDQLGRALEIWESETDELGHQLPTPVGRLDFLCRDTTTNALVVIELKRGRPSDRVVGQAARYMGWVRSHLAVTGRYATTVLICRRCSSESPRPS